MIVECGADEKLVTADSSVRNHAEPDRVMSHELFGEDVLN